MADWILDFIALLGEYKTVDQLELFQGRVSVLHQTKEVMKQVLSEVDWSERKNELLQLCIWIDETRQINSRQDKSFFGLKIVTQPCVVELLSHWLLPRGIDGIDCLLQTVSVDALYEYFSQYGVEQCRNPDFSQEELEKHFTHLHQNLQRYEMAKDTELLRQWGDDLPDIEREDLSGQDPHPLYDRVRAIVRYYTIPEWVAVVDDVNDADLPEFPPLPPPAEAVKLGLAKMDDYTSDEWSHIPQEKHHEVMVKLKYTYQMMPYVGKLQFLDRKIPDRMNDASHFHRYGPVNTGDSLDPDCVRYGGCRMLLCNCQTQGDEWDEEADLVFNNDDFVEEDWFTGECKTCEGPIKRRQYALRLPSEDGGWYGCFCSWDCLDDVNCSIVEKEMIQIMHLQLEEDKIHVSSPEK